VETWRKSYLGDSFDLDVLVVGSGHSELPIEMYEAGWRSITAVDSSRTVMCVI